MPFGLKNALSEFQNIMNDIFTPFTDFSIVYIDDVLIFSKTIDDHWKHLDIFVRIIKQNGLVVLASKISLFQDKIQFLGHNIYKGTLSPIDKTIQFADKFPDEIKDENQLQRFLGSLNYVSGYFQGLRKICKPLYKRLEKNHSFRTIGIPPVNEPSWNHNVLLSIHMKLEKPSMSINIILE